MLLQVANSIKVVGLICIICGLPTESSLSLDKCLFYNLLSDRRGVHEPKS